MPFIPSNGPHIPIFRDILHSKLEFPGGPQSTDHDNAVQTSKDAEAVITADTLAMAAHLLFTEENYHIAFDRQSSGALDLLAVTASGASPGAFQAIPARAPLENGRKLLEHLTANLKAMYPDADEALAIESRAYAVASLLATPDFCHAEAAAMAQTLESLHIGLESKPSSVTVRVSKLEDGSGWGLHKVMQWHAYTKTNSNQLRHMDDGGPILAVDNFIQIPFDAVQSLGDRYSSKFSGEARATLCHVGWADPQLDVLLNKTDPVSDLPLEQSPLQRFASWLYSILADILGMHGIRYTALTMSNLETIIEHRPTIPPSRPNSPPTESTSMVAEVERVAVKRQPGKERHYAARNLHDVPNGSISLAVKSDKTVVRVGTAGIEQRPIEAMLSMAKTSQSALQGLQRHPMSRRSSPPTGLWDDDMMAAPATGDRPADAGIEQFDGDSHSVTSDENTDDDDDADLSDSSSQLAAPRSDRTHSALEPRHTGSAAYLNGHVTFDNRTNGTHRVSNGSGSAGVLSLDYEPVVPLRLIKTDPVVMESDIQRLLSNGNS
jgi:hypothetical protein